jgi:glycosyltransferase involved in cell wall biosynthesis
MVLPLYAKVKRSFSSFLRKESIPIAVFARHCHFSSASAHKKRMPYFSKEKCYQNLLNTVAMEKNVQVTFLLDSFYPMKQSHFVRWQTKYPVIEFQEGNEAGAFLKLLEIVLEQSLDPDTVLYFVEDDYIHKPGWVSILREGISLEKADYVTLYDHKDKYFFPEYEDLESKIFHTSSCHWRTTPSTTNTYAMRKKTLQDHIEIHRKFSLDRKITADHDKFCALKERGSFLISSIPGWATHAEPDFASPCENWEKVLNVSLNDLKK